MSRFLVFRFWVPLIWAGVTYGQVTVSPASLSFSSIAVGNTSAVKTVTVTNKTTAAISFTGIAVNAGGPFAISSNTCGSSLGAGKNCSISATFTPAALGTASGTLTVTDSGSPSSLGVSLSGAGIPPVTLSPAGLSLGSITLGSSSSPKIITLKNGLTSALTIGSIAASAGFSQTTNCPITPNTLTAGGTCSINIVFTPPAVGAASGSLVVTHNAYGSPTTAGLSGTGVTPVTLTPTSLTFGTQNIGGISPAKLIEITNRQTVVLSISSIQTSGDFKQTNNCPTSPNTLISGGACFVNVTFSPTAAGTRAGQLTVSDSATTSPQTASLSGTGAAVLQSIKVTPATAAIGMGGKQQFTATGFYKDGSQKDLTSSVTWTSSRPKIATVAAGLATGVSVGRSIIRATHGEISGAATLTVTNLTLVSIAVTPANPSIALGTQQQFHATGTYSNGSTLDITSSVTWASSSSTVATIAATGLATSKATGQATISAALGAVSNSTGLTVTAAQLTTISVTPTSASIPLGTTKQFTATGMFTDGSMQDLTASASWSSSLPAVATVTSGLAYPVATGTTILMAGVGSVSGSATLTVNPAALVSIAVTPPSPSVALGNTLQFTAAGTFTDGSTQDLTSQVTWAAANTAIASISAAGLAMTDATGTTQITATSGSIIGPATLTVTAATLVSIAVTPAIPTVPLGETQQFTATGTYTDKSIQDITQTVTWSSSNPALASISMTTGTIGLATALSQGVTNIAATQGGISGSTTLTVNPAVLVSISLGPSPLTLPKGSVQQLTATGTYSDGTTQTLASGITWASSNAAVATVSASGQVTVVAATGSATISAQAGSVTGSVVVQATSAVLVSIGVSPPANSVPLGATQQFTATGTYSDASTGDVTASALWTSSNPAVATVSTSSGTAGLAQSLATGSTIISAASGGVSGSANLTVTTAVLVSIAISPSTPAIGLGRSQQFTATGTYTDGSSTDLTTTVTWAASPATVAVISNTAGSQGVATSAGVGAATITVTLGSVTSSATLTVNPAQIVNIIVTSATPAIPAGQTDAFTATATYADGTSTDVTASVTWSSSSTSIATMNGSVATGVAPGIAIITATSGSVQGSASLSVSAVPIILPLPPTFTIDSQTASLGGPLSLNNFGSAYLQGGFVPPGGAKIVITSAVPLPNPPLGDLIFHELVGGTITINSVTTVVVSGATCTEEFYTSWFAPSIYYSNVAVYCPSASGAALYKLYLSYRAGDPAGSQILAAFKQVLGSVQFTQ